MKKYYYYLDGQVYGPVSSEALRGLAEQGTLTPQTQVKIGEEGEWIVASRMKGLFSQSPQPQQPVEQQPQQTAVPQGVSVPTAATQAYPQGGAAFGAPSQGVSGAGGGYGSIGPKARQPGKFGALIIFSRVYQILGFLVLGLTVLAILLVLLGGLTGIAGGLGAGGAAGRAGAGGSLIMSLVMSVGIALYGGLIGISLIAMSEAIKGFVDIVRDTRFNRMLLERIANPPQ